MQEKLISAECLSCESTFGVQYLAEMASQEYPEYCPFCGDPITEVTEEMEEDYDEDFEEQDEW